MFDDRLGWADPIQYKQSDFIPTWQRGQAQPTEQDIAKLVKEGYRRNTLIYACVREKTTALAGLPWAALRPGAEGKLEVVEAHPAKALLDAPNVEMDGYEFKQTLGTHLETAGNAYIRKVRKGPSLAAPPGSLAPIKQLILLRPDRVEIVPADKREDDAFSIVVDGTERARYPRADIIHIKDPDPANDFYGLSAIAVLARVGDLDTDMTDWERAFFRNAGVPFGILTTKTRHTAAEKREIKAGWKRAYQGVRKWFELLILNADEAKYQQLGIPQKDMEMEAEREFVESRICATFGVPPILVGALVGLKRATYANYEMAEFSFWAETMANRAMMVASAFNRELMPEYRTTVTRGDRLVLDMSKVKALQENEDAHHTRIREDVKVGLLTQEEGRMALGYPATPDSGVFLLPVNIVPVSAGEAGQAVPGPKMYVVDAWPDAHKALAVRDGDDGHGRN